MRERVATAMPHQRSSGQAQRLAPTKDVERVGAPDERGAALLRSAFAQGSLSARVSSTPQGLPAIAELSGPRALARNHVAEEASGYRRLDRS
jgi:hypothetical protein